MSRYTLSKNLALLGPDEIEGLPEQYQDGYCILYNKGRDKEYLINDTIRYFIDKFSTPKDARDVISEVAADVQSEPESIKETCLTFMRFLRKKRIIVRENEEEWELIEEPAYKSGDFINQYQVNHLIANKRIIDIYIATDQLNDRKCVIKLLNRKKVQKDSWYAGETAYLQREYDLLRKSEGEEAICQTYGFEQDKEGQVYIVLEWVKGRPIARYARETKTLTQYEMLHIIEKMLYAFARLHEKGTVHGDIHSSNVLVTPDKSVKLIDLGLSINKEIEEKQVVKYGGVDFYMPPERIHTTSAKKYTSVPDFRSDVYQIGLLTYIMLYDTFPFTGFIWEELAAAIKAGSTSYPDVSANGHHVPDALKDIIGKCMDLDPENRFGNAAEILEAYTAYVYEAKAVALTNA